MTMRDNAAMIVMMNWRLRTRLPRLAALADKIKTEMDKLRK